MCSNKAINAKPSVEQEKISTKVIPIENTLVGYISMMSHSSREAASEGPTVLHIYFRSSYNIPFAARTTNPGMATGFHVRVSGRFLDIQSNLTRKNFIDQGSDFLLGSFSNSHNSRVTIQFSWKRQPQHIKGWFYSRKCVKLTMKTLETPALTGHCCENFSSRTTGKHLLLRRNKIRQNIWPEIPCEEDLYAKPCWKPTIYHML